MMNPILQKAEFMTVQFNILQVKTKIHKNQRRTKRKSLRLLLVSLIPCIIINLILLQDRKSHIYQFKQHWLFPCKERTRTRDITPHCRWSVAGNFPYLKLPWGTNHKGQIKAWALSRFTAGLLTDSHVWTEPGMQLISLQKKIIWNNLLLLSQVTAVPLNIHYSV